MILTEEETSLAPNAPPAQDRVTGAAEPDAEKRIEILAVGQSEADLGSLRSIFGHSNWSLFTTQTIAETVTFLQRHFVPVVVCEDHLADGSWKELWTALAVSGRTPHLIVSAPLADDQLWAEVLNLGGYDVLAKPFRPKEMFQVLGLAWRHWHGRKRAAAAGGQG
jgi:DNA-binding response OmpR family regulator